MVKELTCIVCPKGCALKVTLEGKEILKVEGHTCRRGEVYAKDECLTPMRTLTTTAAVIGGGVVPVKTDRTDFGLSNVAATTVRLLGYEPPVMWDESIVD
jgi:CxxC motif-containing protein